MDKEDVESYKKNVAQKQLREQGKHTVPLLGPDLLFLISHNLFFKFKEKTTCIKNF
jgi:hypothetical protein